MYDPDDLSDDLGFTYLVWVDGNKVAALRSFPNAVKLSDTYRKRGFVNVHIDAEKKSKRDSVNEGEI